MLDLTLNARTLIKGLTDNTPDRQGGVRITADVTDARKFSVTIAAEAAPDDVIVETAGARVILGPAAAKTLDNKILDATLANGSVTFTVLNQKR